MSSTTSAERLEKIGEKVLAQPSSVSSSEKMLAQPSSVSSLAVSRPGMVSVPTRVIREEVRMWPVQRRRGKNTRSAVVRAPSWVVAVSTSRSELN
jgi:hypothetical protein